MTNSFGWRRFEIDCYSQNGEEISDLKHTVFYADIRRDFSKVSPATYAFSNGDKRLSGKVYAGMYDKNTLEDKGEFDEGIIYITVGGGYKSDATVSLKKDDSSPYAFNFFGTFSQTSTALDMKDVDGYGTLKGFSYKGGETGNRIGVLGTLYLEKGDYIISGIYSTALGNTLSAYSSSATSFISEQDEVADAIAEELRQKLYPNAEIRDIFIADRLTADPNKIADFRRYKYIVSGHNNGGANIGDIFHTVYHVHVDPNRFKSVKLDDVMSFDRDREFKGSVRAYYYKPATYETFGQFGDASYIEIDLKKTQVAKIKVVLFSQIGVSQYTYNLGEPMVLASDDRGFTVTQPQASQITVTGNFIENTNGYPQLGIVGTISAIEGDKNIVGVYSSDLQRGYNVPEVVSGGYLLNAGDNVSALLPDKIKNRHAITDIQLHVSNSQGTIQTPSQNNIGIGWRRYFTEGYQYEGKTIGTPLNKLLYKAYYIKPSASLSSSLPSDLSNDRVFTGAFYGDLYDRVKLGDAGSIDNTRSNIELTVNQSGRINAELNIARANSNEMKNASFSGVFSTEAGKNNTFSISQSNDRLNGAMYNDIIIGDFKVNIDNAIAEGVYFAE